MDYWRCKNIKYQYAIHFAYRLLKVQEYKNINALYISRIDYWRCKNIKYQCAINFACYFLTPSYNTKPYWNKRPRGNNFPKFPKRVTEDVRLYWQDSESEPLVDFCEYGNERHGSTLGRQFPAHLRHYYLLKD